MFTKIIQFGNSKGIIIPASLLTTLNLNIGDKLEIKENDKNIILKKAYDEIELNLSDVFSKYEKDHGMIKEIKNEVNWGKPVGKEVW